MNQADFLKILAAELGTSDLQELNKILREKGEEGVKFRLNGEALGYLGVTGAFKAITSDGVKVFTTGRVTLVRFADIESCVKAKLRSERPVRPKKTPAEKAAERAKAGPAKKMSEKELIAKIIKDKDEDDYEDDDIDDDEMEIEIEEVKPKRRPRPTAPPKGQSRFFTAGQRSRPKVQK